MNNELTPTATKTAFDSPDSGVIEAAPDSGLRSFESSHGGDERNAGALSGHSTPLRERLSRAMGTERSSLLLETIARQTERQTRAERLEFDIDAPWRRLGIYQSAAREL